MPRLTLVCRMSYVLAERWLLPAKGPTRRANGLREPSIFAVGLPLEDARRLGDAFGQDAIVWVGSDAVPQLVLLR